MKKICERVTVTGAVQGVGYRPFVKMLADRFGLAGHVRNSGGIVRILVSGGEDEIAAFARALVKEAPEGAAVASVERVRVTGTSQKTTEAEGCVTGSFAILSSDGEGEDGFPFFVPDLAVCPSCLKEMLDPGDRRYHYPLISCVACGPRYSILEAFPYDRERTVMREFAMCAPCASEYAPKNGVKDSASGAPAAVRILSGRRQHAQTISCPDCGPQMMLVKADIQMDDWLGEAVRILRDGGILGVKGLGGFQLLADPRRVQTVARLREIKGRETKPFAVMFPDIESIRVLCEVSEAEEELLTSSVRPIVLLSPRGSVDRAEDRGPSDAADGGSRRAVVGADGGSQRTVGDADDGSLRTLGGGDASELPPAADGRISAGSASAKEATHSLQILCPGKAVCGDSAFIGVMLPSTGVHKLLADACGPLIVTSANLSGAPMITLEEDFKKAFLDAGCADGVLTHPRRILAPVDDSVVYVTDETDRVHILRRARGYVPVPVEIPELTKAQIAVSSDSGDKGNEDERVTVDTGACETTPGDILAFGADMKASFGMARGGRVILSQPFGDLEELSVRRAYLAELDRLTEIYSLKPVRVVCDAHPGYQSSRIAREYAAMHGIPLQQVFHHHAHVLAVMAEHGLSSCIGLACDGTGYGEDGGIWGCEVLGVGNAESIPHGAPSMAGGGNRAVRLAHLPAFQLVGGDQAAVDADLSALCLLYAWENYNEPASVHPDAFGSVESGAVGFGIHDGAESRPPGSILPGIAGERADSVLAMLHAGAGVPCTSAGRLFDAVAALLDIAHTNTFEGACAQALEAAAHRYLQSCSDMSLDDSAGCPNTSCRDSAVAAGETDPFAPLVGFVCSISSARRAGADPDYLALCFHRIFADCLVRAACDAAARNGEKKLVLCGGTFANRLLRSDVSSSLKASGLEVYEASGVPCGDGGIALGQVYAAKSC